MAVLNEWQRFDRAGLFGGQPWGTGSAGNATISADPNTRATYTATATQTAGTAGSTAFANGDLVILHQTQGTGVGQWECNRVASGGGSTSLTMVVANKYTYGTGAQIIKVPQYLEATVSAHSVTAWNGTTGGVEVILAKTSITVSGALTASALGFRGGQQGYLGPQYAGIQGEGSNGSSSTRTTSANYSGGGGGPGTNDGGVGGGGGSHAASGATGTSRGGTTGGAGASTTTGSADLTLITFGGGGGGGGTDDSKSSPTTYGGNGGAIIILISKSITLSAAVVSLGADAAKDSRARGGGGAGGSVLGVCETASLGTQITATGGYGSSTEIVSPYSDIGGYASTGRVAIHHSGTVTGTTSPAFTDTTDLTLREKTGAFLAFM